LTGAALADYDGDGYLDLYVCSYGYFQGAGNHALPVPYYDAHDGPPNHLYRNRGDGTFEEVTEASGLGQGNNRYSFACIWADIAGSGRPDLFVINDFGQNDLYHNLGHGRFELVSAGLPGHGAGMSATAADFAGRGLELYVGNMWAPDGSRVTADAAFRRRYAGAAGGQMREMAAGNRLYAASGTGNAGPGLQPRACGAANAGWAWSCGAVDVANSGRPDLFCVNGFLTAPEDSGKPKPAVDDFFWQQIISRSPLAGQPVTPNYRAAWGAGFRLAHRDHSWNGGQRNVLFLNLGDGQFADASAAGGVDFPDDGRAFAVFDCDGNGDCDLALRSRTGPQLRLLRNDAAGIHGSLAVTLRGTRGNRDAIGAQLRLATAAGSQVRELGAGSGFLSQHSKRLIFGLGDERSAQLRVRWPGGALQDFPGLEAGYEYTLTEGQPTPARRPLAPRGSATAAPATATAIPTRFSTPLVEALALPAVATAGLAPARAGRARLLWIAPRDSVASAGLGLVVAWRAAPDQQVAPVAWDTSPEPFRTFWRTTLRFLYDRRRELAMPTGLLLGQAAGAGGAEALLKVYWGGAPQTELAADLARPPQGGAEVLPFPGRALLCSFRRDTRALGAAMQTA
ncbi:MAG: CRTAC1 family protein, partial [Terriglobales bacterium]